MKLKGFLILVFGFIMSSCDSGDIIPEPPKYDDTRTLNIKYTLSGVNTIPDTDLEENKLKLMFVLHSKDGTTQYEIIHNAVEDEEQNIMIKYVPYEVDRLDLSIVGTTNDDIIYTFDSISIPDGEEGETERDIQFNNASKPINLVSFERIEAQLFDITCSRCHGTSGHVPYLTGINVYKNIVNRASPHPLQGMKIIAPKDFSISSMYQILVDDEMELGYPHSSAGLTKVNDITLLKSWIEAGAPNN